MKLALLVVYYPPSSASAAVQMSDLAAALVRGGHDVTVFTTSADIETPTVAREDGVTVVRAATGRVKGIGLARRALSELFMSFALWRAARCHDVRVTDFVGLIWYSPTIFLAPFVAWLKRRNRARAYLILRDIFPQWALDAGVMKRGLAYYCFRAFELFQYRVADVVGVQSPNNLGQVRSDTPSGRELEVLFNWLDLGRSEPRPTDVPDQHGLAGKRILVYGGNMGVAQDMDNLLRLARRLGPDEDIAFLFVGAGSEVERMRRTVVEWGLPNVAIVDEVDPETFRAILRRCHAGLITLDRRLTTHNIPGKLLAYLEAGLPVVASVNPGNDLLTMLTDSGAGLGFVNGEDEALARATRELVLDPARCASMSQSARTLAAERFNVETIAYQITVALRGAGQKATDGSDVTVLR